MSWAAIAVGVVSIGVGAYQSSRANKKQKDAIKNRKAYETPEEVFTILNALQNKAQGDTQTRDYETNLINRSFANQLDVVQLLGGDPNDAAAAFDRHMQGIITVGDKFHATNLEGFGKYIGGLDMVAKSRDAEWGWQDNQTKDLIAALNQQKEDANKTINSGLNLTMQGVTNLASNNLYNDNYTLPPPTILNNSGQVVTTTPAPVRTTGTAPGTIVTR
ncbi:MAG TPA: hypothetical protein PLX17_05845 [Chitinophagaceae bacterium]|nr:hypothetical protein [Chitinophagaceae bacterium]